MAAFMVLPDGTHAPLDGCKIVTVEDWQLKYNDLDTIIRCTAEIRPTVEFAVNSDGIPTRKVNGGPTMTPVPIWRSH